MHHSDVMGILGTQLLVSLPQTVGWIGAVVVAGVLKARRGGAATTLLLIGGCLMLCASLLRLPLPLIVPLLVDTGEHVARAAAVVSIPGAGIELLRLGGIVCLVLAFWQQCHGTENHRESSSATSA